MRVQIRVDRHIEPPRRRFPVRLWRGKAPVGRYCLNRRGRGKYDPSRAGAGGVPGRPGCGHGDRPVPPGFAGVSAWQPAFVACAFSAGSGDCSICGPGNNDGRSRTPGHSRSPGKTVDAVVRHGSPWRRFRRAGTTATEHGKRDLIYRGWSVGSFGTALTKPRARPRGFARGLHAEAGYRLHERRHIRPVEESDATGLSLHGRVLASRRSRRALHRVMHRGPGRVLVEPQATR